MDRRHRLNTAIGASLVTGLVIILFRYFSFPNIQPGDTSSSLFVALVLLLATNLLAAVPGLFWLQQQKVPYPILVSLFAVLEASVLSYGLSPMVLPIGWLAWAAMTLLLVGAAYLLGNYLFNETEGSPRRKVEIATLIVAATALASILAPVLVG